MDPREVLDAAREQLTDIVCAKFDDAAEANDAAEADRSVGQRGFFFKKIIFI